MWESILSIAAALFNNGWLWPVLTHLAVMLVSVWGYRYLLKRNPQMIENLAKLAKSTGNAAEAAVDLVKGKD